MYTWSKRISERGNRSTSIYNIFTNVIDRTEQIISGILLIDIIDHKEIFTSVDDSHNKKDVKTYWNWSQRPTFDDKFYKRIKIFRYIYIFEP